LFSLSKLNAIDIFSLVINIVLMNLKQMEVFRAVMATGSVSSAALLLHVTPPGVSRMMKHLQLQLGVPLFERLGNRLVPTADAHKLHREIERVYSGIEQVNQVASALKTGSGAQLNVICSPSVAVKVGPQAVAHMLRHYPDLTMRLETRPVYDIYQQLTSQQSDVAISLVPIEHPSLHHRLLARVGMVVVLPASHALATKKILRVQDLAKLPLIRFPVETTQGATMARLLAEEGLQANSRVTVRIARDACALVAQGVGAAVIDALTASHLNDPAIAVRPLQHTERYHLSALWSKDYPLTRLGQEFIEQVRQGVTYFTQAV
jgi:DNA-binding transcriptional LysR family regulator